jgi:hypothetical protein
MDQHGHPRTDRGQHRATIPAASSPRQGRSRATRALTPSGTTRLTNGHRRRECRQAHPIHTGANKGACPRPAAAPRATAAPHGLARTHAAQHGHRQRERDQHRNASPLAAMKPPSGSSRGCTSGTDTSRKRPLPFFPPPHRATTTRPWGINPASRGSPWLSVCVRVRPCPSLLTNRPCCASIAPWCSYPAVFLRPTRMVSAPSAAFTRFSSTWLLTTDTTNV